MKKVYTLYRVSTKGQVDKDDIPVQKSACRDYVASHADWKLEREIYEKGVSGFKVAASDRDAIREIRNDAVAGKFDILLVFKFDRLGRKHDETPFIVEGLARLGIEVWSVTEGQQRFDTEADTLINFITFWQASTESKNTSVRTKAGMAQTVLAGRYKGGTPPYGYRLEKCGVNKRGQDIHNLAVDDVEAELVRTVFDRYVNYGYGVHRLAGWLTEQGYRTRADNTFVAPTIRGMLRNITYIGILRCGESRSKPMERLRIIDDDTFRRAQRLLRERSNRLRSATESTLPRVVMGQSLLSGNVFCGSCGGRLMATTMGRKYTKKDGTEEVRRYPQYVCYNHTRHKGSCFGRTSYRANKIDDAITEIVLAFFERLKSVPMAQIIESQYSRELADKKARLSAARKALKKHDEDLLALKAEVAPAIRGESRFTPELLTDAIALSEDERAAAAEIVASLEAACESTDTITRELKANGERFLSYARIFEESDIDVRKMVVANLIDRVTVYGDRIDVEWNVTAQQYFETAA
jgi:DNA invertase Pin-like site-specific DNA recombinase